MWVKKIISPKPKGNKSEQNNSPQKNPKRKYLGKKITSPKNLWQKDFVESMSWEIHEMIFFLVWKKSQNLMKSDENIFFSRVINSPHTDFCPHTSSFEKRTWLPRKCENYNRRLWIEFLNVNLWKKVNSLSLWKKANPQISQKKPLKK